MIYHPSSGKMEEYNDAKPKLGKNYEYITDGIIMRSTSQWYGESEKYINLSLEKRNEVKSHIRKMRLNKDEEETADPKKIGMN